jgi:hypothetical protein
MSIINVERVDILKNPARFTDDIAMRITFDCVAPGITEGEQWRLESLHEGCGIRAHRLRALGGGGGARGHPACC